jgi:biopolymer transport protein ExbD
MNFQRNKRRPRASLEINLIPMIDVVLVLLIFFVVSTTFNRNSTINIDLPEANTQQANTYDDKMITLIIDKKGDYFIAAKNEMGAIKNQKLKTETLKEDLASLRGNSPQTPFVISADAKTPHQAVIHALDIASQVGFKHIAFATQEPETETAP